MGKRVSEKQTEQIIEWLFENSPDNVAFIIVSKDVKSKNNLLSIAGGKDITDQELVYALEKLKINLILNGNCDHDQQTQH